MSKKKPVVVVLWRLCFQDSFCARVNVLPFLTSRRWPGFRTGKHIFCADTIQPSIKVAVFVRCPSYRTGKWLPIQGNTICRALTKVRRNMIRSENSKICERRIDEHKVVLFKDSEIAATVPFQNRAMNSTLTVERKSERKSTTDDLWFRFVRMDTKVQAGGACPFPSATKLRSEKKTFSAKKWGRSFGYCNKSVNCMSLTNMNWTVSYNDLCELTFLHATFADRNSCMTTRQRGFCEFREIILVWALVFS